MLSGKRILITGAAGFIGANLTRAFYRGNKVSVLIKPKSDLWRIDDIKKKLTIFENDLLDAKSISEITSRVKPQVIFHLAAFGNSSFHEGVEEIMETNILGTMNLLLALKDHNFECFINTGSSSEYGFKKQPMKESDSLVPNSFYSVSKASATMLAQTFATLYKKPVFTVRPFSVYGPWEDPKRLIATAIAKALANKSMELVPNVARHDFVYVGDVVDFYVMLSQKADKISWGSVYNIGTGKQWTNEQVVEMLFKLVGKKAKIKKGKYANRLWDSPFWVADMSKVKEELGWVPKESLSSGLLKTIEWFRTSANFKRYGIS